ncbi:MAG: hypothetical protein EKK34_00560 [Mycobacterium sp.]|nr:MAG: hypothetical protein EKK34_00560 [Mycobacterium sp.]
MTGSASCPDPARPRRWRPRAGKALRARLNTALLREGDKLGKRLAWDEREAHHVDAACRAADHVESLQRRLNEETDGQNKATIVVQLTAEIRLLNKSNW